MIEIDYTLCYYQEPQASHIIKDWENSMYDNIVYKSVEEHARVYVIENNNKIEILLAMDIDKTTTGGEIKEAISFAFRFIEHDMLDVNLQFKKVLMFGAIALDRIETVKEEIENILKRMEGVMV